jgi:hypothetical protein
MEAEKEHDENPNFTFFITKKGATNLATGIKKEYDPTHDDVEVKDDIEEDKIHNGEEGEKAITEQSSRCPCESSEKTKDYSREKVGQVTSAKELHLYQEEKKPNPQGNNEPKTLHI